MTDDVIVLFGHRLRCLMQECVNGPGDHDQRTSCYADDRPAVVTGGTEWCEECQDHVPVTPRHWDGVDYDVHKVGAEYGRYGRLLACEVAVRKVRAYCDDIDRVPGDRRRWGAVADDIRVILPPDLTPG